MLLFRFPNIEATLRFYQVCCELNAVTEQERNEILLDFARYGEIESVSQTNRSREQLLQDLSKHFKVLDIRHKDEENGS